MVGWRRWAASALLALGGAAAAQGPEQAVIDQLARQGYVEFEVSRTLLGRIRVVALTPGGERREIVFNPATGEILRDFVDGSGLPQVLDRPPDGEAEEPIEGVAVSDASSGGGEVAGAAGPSVEPKDDGAVALAPVGSEPVADPEEPDEDDADEGDGKSGRHGGGNEHEDRD